MNYFILDLNELGFEGEEAGMRTMTLFSTVTWEPYTFVYIPRKKRRGSIGRRIEPLTSKAELNEGIQRIRTGHERFALAAEWCSGYYLSAR